MHRFLPLLALCGVAVAANADPRSGGFQGPDNYRLITVAETADLPDDSLVRLEGYIARSLGDEEYEFRDDTGTLIVEIDDDDWGGLEATPEVRVQLDGEIDREGQDIKLDADSVRAAQ